MCLYIIHVITYSMSYTVRKACLNDWCQARLIDVDVLDIKVSKCQVDTLEEHVLTCCRPGWFWSKASGFPPRSLVESEVENNHKIKTETLRKRNLSSHKITSITFTRRFATEEYQSLAVKLPRNFHFSVHRWALSGYEPKRCSFGSFICEVWISSGDKYLHRSTM